MSWLLRNLVYSKIIGRGSTSPLVRKAVLLAMADRANDDGTGIWISKVRIAAELEANRETVIKAVQDLCSPPLRLLKAVGERPCRNGFTIEYAIQIGALQALPDAWRPCRNSDTLDDALVDGEPVNNPVRKPVSKRGRTSAEVSELPPEDVGAADTTHPSRTILLKNSRRAHRVSDADLRVTLANQRGVLASLSRQFDAETGEAQREQLQVSIDRMRARIAALEADLPDVPRPPSIDRRLPPEKD